MRTFLIFLLSLSILSCDNHTSSPIKGKDSDSVLNNNSATSQLEEPIHVQLDTATTDLVNAISLRYLQQQKALSSDDLKLIETESYLAWGYAVLQQCDSAKLYISKIEKQLPQLEENNSSILAYSNYSLAKALESIGEYSRAIAPLERAVDIEQNLSDRDFALASDIYTALANNHCLIGNYHMGLPNFKKAYQIRKEYLPNDNIKLIETWAQIGGGHFYLWQLDSTLFYFQDAIRQFQESGINAQSQIAECKSNMGLVYVMQQKFDTAIVYLNEALEAQRKILEKDDIQLANTLQNLTNAYSRSNNPIKALGYVIEASEIAENALCSEHPELAYYLHSVGVIYRSLSDYSKAEQYLNKALAVAINKPDIEAVYTALGRLKHSLGKNEEALRLLNKGLRLQSNNFQDNFKSDLSSTYISISLVLNEMEQYQAAIDSLNKALPILKRDTAYFYIALVYDNFGLNYTGLDDYKTAERYFRLAIETRGESPLSNTSLASSYYYLGSALFNQERYDEAETNFNKALRILNYKKLEEEEASETPLYAVLRILIAKAMVYQKRYMKGGDVDHLLEADRIFKENFEVLDKVLQKYQDSKIYFLNARFYTYEYAIRNKFFLFKETGDTKYQSEAFQLSEKSKSSILQQSFLESTAKGVAGIPDSLIERERKLKIDIAWLKEQLYLLSQDSSSTEAGKRSYRIDLFDYARELDDLLKQLEQDYPKYYKAKYEEPTISLAEIQDELLQKNQALIEYFVGDSSIFIFVIKPNDIHIKEVKRDFPLQEWIEDLRINIDSISPQYATPAYQLYLKLLRPVDSLLHKGTELIIIPDALLNNIPFDALLTSMPKEADLYRTHEFLLKKYPISTTYSAYLLWEMQQKKHMYSKKQFLGFAPEFFENNDKPLLAQNISIGTRSKRSELDPLEYSEEEIENIAKVMGGKKVFKKAASKENFFQLAPKYRILHLSTHGEANSLKGQYSFLAFSENKDSSINDWLYNQELYNLQLEADMVVLSACETNIGELQRAEGVLSLARGFTYAGTKSIITTLWKIEDRSTAQLMPFFYENIKLGDSKLVALHNAKREMLEKTEFAAPYYWAAFVPIGDMSPIEIQSGTPIWIWVLLAAAVGLLLFFFLRKKSTL